MHTGHITWFDLRKGHGLVRSDDGVSLVVSYQDVEHFGRNLHPGDRVSFDLVDSGKGPTAVNVVVISRADRPTIAKKPHKELTAPRKRLTVDSSILVGQALLAKQQKQYDKARKLFEDAIEQGPKTDIFFTYAAMERELGEYERARTVFKRGIDKFPDSGKLYEDYGMLELRRVPERAADIFRDGLAKAPAHKILHRYLGEVLYHLGGQANLREAARQFDLARRAGRLDEQSLHLARLVDVLTGNQRGRLAVEFLAAAKFSVEHIAPHRLRTYAVDFLIRPEAVEYKESYDLAGEILVRCFFKTAVGVTDVRQFVTDLQVETLRPKSREVGFIVVQNSSEIRDYLYGLLEGAGRNPTVVPIDESLMRGAMAAGECEPALKQILDEWLYGRNLYEENFPVSGRRFFGREQELAALTRAIDTGTPVGLFGLRKVGKTSLLKKLKEKRPQDLVAYVDLQSVPAGVADAGYIYWELANQLRAELSQKYPKLEQGLHFSLAGKYQSYSQISNIGLLAAQFDGDIRLLKSITSAATAKVVVLIDEIERLLPSQNNTGFAGFADFLAYLRGRAQQDSNFVSIVTGANPSVSEVSQWDGRDNPVFKFFREMFLPPLEKVECDEMVCKLGRGMGVTYSNDSLKRIYAATGRAPVCYAPIVQ